MHYTWRLGEVRRACFVRGAGKHTGERRDHEPVVIDLASGFDCSSDTDTASMTEGI